MADALANKGILYAKIEVENGIYLHVFNVHTQASYENYNTPYYIVLKNYKKQYMCVFRKRFSIQDMIN